MKAKQRILGVLLFLILLAGGVFALLTLRNAREEQAASAAADGTIPLAAVSGNDLTQIVLHYQGETNTLLYTADGWTLADGETVTLKANSEPAAESDSNAYQTVWRLAGDTAADLDETKVDAILSALCAYVSAQATDADPAAYGFEAPLVTAEVTTADGTINLTYAMGTDGCYLMVEGDSSVYTVDASVVSALLYPADQLKAE